MIRVAAVGTGYWGPNLARNLHGLGALAAVCDVVPERATSLAGRFGARAVTEFEALLADPAIEALVLATPVTTHFDMARRGLEAGKHVFVEKPLALTSRDAEALCALAAERRRTLMVGHLLHYHPAVTALQELVEAGELGEIRHLRCIRFNLGKLRAEENVLWSFAPHDLSLTLRFVGREPDSVRAIGHRILGTPREDIVYADLDFGAVKGQVQVSWVEPIKQHQFMLIGTRRMAVFNDILKEGKLRLYDRGFDPQDGGLALRDNGERIVDLAPIEPMRAELEDFLRCCETGAEPLAGGRDGVRVVRTLERITETLRAGKEIGVGC
jgi:UDP-2-acetamido-3-amino-2,3-dideoxy-glucuronate N-acetyltransferase